MTADRAKLEVTKLERSALGAVLRARGRQDHVLGQLAERDFADPEARQVFRAMISARIAGVVDYATTAAALLRLGASEAFVSRLPELTADVTPDHADAYAERVREASIRRRLAAIEPARAVAEHETSAEAIADLRAQLDDLDSERPQRGLLSALEIARGAYERLEAAQQAPAGTMRGLATGIYRLDRCLSGLRAGGLYVVGARPGQGKTALGLNIATHAALRLRRNVLVCSLEMSALEIGDRIVCSEARISTEALGGARLEDEQWRRVGVTLSRFGETGFWLDERSATRIDDLIATARRLHGTAPLSLVLVDYLQLCRGSRGRRYDSREQEVAEVSRGLKSLAKLLGCPVLALAQLNRDIEKRPVSERRPRLSDFRESGGIEADADAAIGIHVPHAHDESADPSTAELIVLKHRHGAPGIATVRWAAELVRFDNAEVSA